MSQILVFQTDSDIVKNAYQSKDNYLIEYDESQSKDHCAIYFSSNEIYYPNDEKVFQRSILEQNKFEWFGTRVPYAHKHIFVRDIQKQWYLTGVNSSIDSPEKLTEFLKAETEGYKITTLGSSAGGFAAVLFGSLLKARLMLSFNGQFQVHSLLNTSKEAINPVIFRFKQANKLLVYFDAKPFIFEGGHIFYFYSNGSGWDCEQREHIEDKNINIIEFATAHHGIPFLKCNLPAILKMSKEELLVLSGKVFSPLIFSIKRVGVAKTLNGLYEQIRKKYL
jgi:hypothetical protein